MYQLIAISPKYSKTKMIYRQEFTTHLLPGRVRPLITAQILRYASMGKLINHDPQSPGRTKFSTFRMHDGRRMHCSPFKKEKKRQQLFLS